MAAKASSGVWSTLMVMVKLLLFMGKPRFHQDDDRPSQKATSLLARRVDFFAQEGPLTLVAGQLERTTVVALRVFALAAAEIGAERVKQVVARELCLEGRECGQGRSRALAHADRDGTVHRR